MVGSRRGTTIARRVPILNLASIVLVVLFSACGDLFVKPAASVPAGLDVSFALAGDAAATGGTADAYEKANELHLRVSRGASILKDTVVALRSGAEETRVRLSIDPEQNDETVRLDVEVRLDGAGLFRGGADLSIRAGATSEAAVTLQPIPAGIGVSPTTATLTSIGDSIRIAGAVTFATGDTITGATVQWASSNASVASVTADGLVVARSNGQATVTASHGPLVANVTVTVRQTAASIVFVPDNVTVRVGETVTVEPIVRDAGQNRIPNPAVDSWSSSNTGVATVDGQGRVTGRAAGSTLVTARIGTVSGSISVQVTAPPPTVTTGPAVDVDSASATLTGTVNPRGLATQAWFEYGTTPSLGQATTSAAVGSADLPQSIRAGLFGLVERTTYYYRAVAQSVSGRVHGAILTFQTDSLVRVPNDSLFWAANAGVLRLWDDDPGLDLEREPIGATASYFQVERRPGALGGRTELPTYSDQSDRNDLTDFPGVCGFDHGVRSGGGSDCSPLSNIATIELQPHDPDGEILAVIGITSSGAQLIGYMAPPRRRLEMAVRAGSSSGR